MQDSNLPAFVQTPWASGEGSSYVRNVPVAPGTGNAASFTTGFPPITFTPVGSGGAGPDGRDMNGILQYLTTWLQWQQAGFFPAYNSAFSTYIGGYPSGAILLRASGVGFWRSTADNNTTDPDTGGAGWVLHGASSVFGRTGDVVAQTGDYAVNQITGAVADTDFTGTNQSLAATGYQRFPGGLIHMWGTHTNAGDYDSITFPTMTGAGSPGFPSACLNVTLTNLQSAYNSGSTDNQQVYGVSATGFYAGARAAERTFYWFAIGY